MLSKTAWKFVLRIWELQVSPRRDRWLASVIGSVVLGSAVALSSACSSAEDSSASSGSCAGDLETLQRDVFAKSCNGSACHSGATPAANLDLSSPGVVDRLVDRGSGTCDGWQLVVPGQPEQSLLWVKVFSDHQPCGDPMPLGKHLRATELSCVRKWIEELAPTGGCETCGGEQCVDVQSDPSNCGACGIQCPSGSACIDGDCTCPAALTFCGGQCVDLTSNPTHCGACDTACAANALCSAGACLCPSGLTDCGGVCVDTASDPNHCGKCDQGCSGAQVCLARSCADGCGTLTQCGQACVDTNSSATHCGACDAPCGGGSSCLNGACRCPAGTELCGGTCINVLSDPNNCGSCGATCGPGRTCSAGACACDGGPATYAADVEPIMIASCTARGCHGNIAPKAGLSLLAGVGYDQLVNVYSSQCSSKKRVAPGSPSESYLVDKLTGSNLCFGSQMPKAGQSLPAAQLDIVNRWICSGAQR